MNPYLHNYDRHLSRSCRKLPVDALHPLPSLCWPEENITLYMKYRTWLFEGGAGYTSASNIYMPIAGHILGLNPVPYPQWDLAKDPEKVLAFARARGGSAFRMRMTGLAMNKFRRFIRLELGMKEAPRFKPFATERYIAGFPDWLATELGRYQRSLERNWRPTRVQANLQGFWSKQGRMWRFLCEKQGVKAFSDLKRVHILAFIDHLLDEKYASSTVNCYLLNLRKSSAASVLTITSYSVKQPIANLVLSNSIRAATVGLTKSLALELGGEGIRFNSILPAWTETERVTQLMTARAAKNGTTMEEELAKQSRESALGRMAQPSEFANAAVFLVSPAASYITGVMLSVDGGMYKGTL